MSAVIEEPNPVAAAERRLYTYEQLVAELSESNALVELWDGELTMSPTPSFYHQEITLWLYRSLYDWVNARGLGKVVAAPMDMVLSEHRAVQPDVLFIAKERFSIIERVVMGPADLVVEVISLGGRNRDRIEKRDLYEQYGIKEYWIVDPEPRTVDVLTLTNGRYELAMRCGPGQTASSSLLPGFEIAVDHLFQTSV